MEHYADKFKSKPLSWILRLSNENFTSLTYSIYTNVEACLKDDKMLMQHMQHLGKVKDEILSMKPVQSPNALTKKINDLHTERKNLITGVGIRIKSFQTSPIAFEEKASIELYEWFTSFGKRLYDLGIQRLTQVSSQMLYDIENNETIKDGLKAAQVLHYFERVKLCNEGIQKAQMKRTKEIVKIKKQRPYLEVKNDIYAELYYLQLALLIGLQNRPTKELELIYTVFGNTLTDFHRAYQSSKARREKKKKEQAANRPPSPQQQQNKATDNKLSGTKMKINYVSDNPRIDASIKKSHIKIIKR